MPLEFELSDDRPLVREGITCFLCDSSVILPSIPEEKDFCYCKIIGCENEYMYAFTGSTDYKGDKFSMFSQVNIDYTVSFYITNITTEVETELIEGVHGALNEFDANTNQFIVDWTLIGSTLGNGIYDLKMVETYAGQDYTTEYKTFLVTPFDTELADGTIRLTSYINGEIENLADFKTYNVFSQIRLNGEVVLTSIQNELDTTPNKFRKQLQTHDREFNEYDVIIDQVEEKYYRLLVNNYFMSDIIEVNDYNIMNMDFRNLELRKSNIELEYTSKFRTKLTLKAVDYVQGRVKRT